MSSSTSQNEKSIGYKLKLAQHILRTKMDEALKSVDLTTPQYAVLSQLQVKPGISNAELARASFITAQTMHGIVSNLEKANLIIRKKDLTHGRILRTELTNQGVKVVNAAHNIIRKVEAKMTKTMTKTNKDNFVKSLIECIENLNTSSDS